MKQYLTYEEYTQIGGTLDSTAFNRNIDRACAIIDENTFCRLKFSEQVSDRVRACVRDLVEYVSENPVGSAVASKSQSAGGVSESVSYATKTVEDFYDDVRAIVYDYLSSETDECGTPLLYRGCSR